jgi:hypothetical protein
VLATIEEPALALWRARGPAADQGIGVKIREAAKIGVFLGLGRHWSAHVDEGYCGGGRDSLRFG